jgi:transposase-like protein
MEFAEIIKKTQLKTVCKAIDAFGPDFLDADVCRKFVFKYLHPEGARCPECGAGLDETKSSRFWQGKAVKCRQCGKTFTIRTGTALAGKGLSVQEIVLMLWLLSRGETDIRIAKIVGCNRETVRLWRRKTT